MYLAVQPREDSLTPWDDRARGWDVRLYNDSGMQVGASGGFATADEATDLARLTSRLVATYHPLRVHFDASPPELPTEGRTTVVYRTPTPVHHEGWKIAAARPDVGQVARSRAAPPASAYNSLRFIEQSAQSAGQARLPVHITSTCRCDTPDRCGHHDSRAFAPAPTEPDDPLSYLSVNPDYDKDSWWQVTVRHPVAFPLVRSLQLPARSDGLALAGFVSELVAVGGRDLWYDPPVGWPRRAGADPADDAVVVDAGQVLGRGGAPAGWQLRANSADGTVRFVSGPVFPSLTSAHEALDFVEQAVRCFPVDDPHRRPAPLLEVHNACACGERWDCRHFSNLPELAPDPAPEHPERAATLGVYVRPYTGANRGWEVVTTEPDGSPWQTSGRHPTVEEAAEARDFMERMVNTHPQLHILGWDPQMRFGPDVATYEPPSRDEAPTVGIFSPAPDAPWFVQCRRPDGTVDATSPPYATYQAADEALDQLGLLSVATSGCDLGYRARSEVHVGGCPCSRAGWRCEHYEDERAVEAAVHERGGGLSL